MTKDHTKQLWYTRRAKQIRGPFPAGMICRHILLGRIQQTDELSINQNEWHLVSQLTEMIPELVPEEMKLDLSKPENQTRLEMAIRREDERQAGDRRENGGGPQERKGERSHKGRGDERRGTESTDVLRHREIKTAISQSLHRPPEKFGFRFVWLLIFLAGIIWVAMSTTNTPTLQLVSTKCQHFPLPEIDWSHCRKEGENLSNSNLAGANLKSASFNGANLSYATMVSADLSYANFANSLSHDSNLQYAKLVGAVLRNANFSNADFSHTDLSYAILNGANLSHAKFRGANLTHVVLNDADITGADFTDAILDKAIWIDNTVCAPESVGKCQPIPIPSDP